MSSLASGREAMDHVLQLLSLDTNLVADRESASVHWQVDSVDKVGLIRCKKNRHLRDVHRYSSSPGKVSDDTVFRDCFLTDR